MSTVKADSLQPTISGNNLILKTGSGDVERVRIDPNGQISFSSTTGTTFSGQVNFSNATRFPGGIGVGGGFAGTPFTAVDVVNTNTSLLDPGVNNYSSTRSRSNLSVRGSGTQTTLFVGNSSDSAVWLQAQNSDNSQKIISLNPVGGSVGIGTTGPSAALDVVGSVVISGGMTLGNFGGGNVAPLPTSSAGVGQFVNISNVASYTLPSGGNWLYYGLQYDQRTGISSNMNVYSTSGIAVGGTTIMTYAGLQYSWFGFAWRIS